MRGKVVIGPEHGSDGLLAHLLGDGHPVLLDLAVGVVGAGADPELARVLQQHELHLAAGALAHRLDRVGGGEPRGRDAVEDRCRGRALHAQRFEFPDVLLDRGRIASGPAGNHGLRDGDVAGPCARLVLQRQGENTR
jgi:hypothetical protein